MNDPQKPLEIQNWGHFCKMCAYDPMSPSSATPDHHVRINLNTGTCMCSIGGLTMEIL